MTKQTTRKGSLCCLYASNAMIYAFNALFYCFLPIYFNTAYTPVEAGILLSIGPAVSIVAPMFWGVLADRASYKNSVLSLTVLLSAVFFFLIKFEMSFSYMCVLVAVVMLFMSPHPALIDAITLEHTSRINHPYGFVRIMGTLGFGVISLISSFFTGGDLDVIFYIFAVMSVVCVIALTLSPQIKGHAHISEAEKKEGAKNRRFLLPLLKAKKLWLLIFVMLVAQFGYSCFTNYFPTYMTYELNLPPWMWGLCILLNACGEIPFFMLFNKLFGKVGIRPIVCTAIAASIVRYVLFGFVTNSVGILIITFCTGFLTTVTNYCGSTYITKCIAPELQATGQNLLYCVGQALPRVLGGFLGGIMISGIGTKGSMLLIAGITAAAALVCFVTVGRDRSAEMGPLEKYHPKNTVDAEG